MSFSIAVLCISDRSYRNEREDLSGPAIIDFFRGRCDTAAYETVPDEKEMISEALIKMCAINGVRIVFTTGGTGFSPRDVTPEATLAVAEKNAFGISEAMRAGTMCKTPKAMLSRGVSVIRNNVLIVNLPGSPKAVRECLEIISPCIEHAAETLAGEVTDG